MENKNSSWQPLQGIRVADFTQVIAGPACSMLLADMGADVIKIEPLTGDFWRQTTKGSAFLNFNRNKRSIAINLKAEEGYAAVMRIIKKADVLLENFSPGTMAKLNLDYDKVTKENPQIIYCSISGFGQTGPYRERPGYDPVAQAMSGIMINTGEPDRPPVRVLPTMVDYLVGNHMAYAIALALLDRQKTGKGKHFDIALLDVAIMQMGQFFAMYSMTGELPSRMGSGYLAAAPYQAFETKDGYIYIAVTTNEMWKNLCQALNLKHLYEDPRFSTLDGRCQGRAELASEITKITKQYKSQELETILVKANVPCGRLMNIDEIMQDPQVIHRQIIGECEYPQKGKVKIIKTPIFADGRLPQIRRRPPLIGEHSIEILREFGYRDEEIQSLLNKGVIRQSKE
ncbi:MAG: CaiB/BaiF CoA transferase family protein [Thermodesulfobacteriota bacterium]